jgi:hypothetical protein
MREVSSLFFIGLYIYLYSIIEKNQKKKKRLLTDKEFIHLF